MNKCASHIFFKRGHWGLAFNVVFCCLFLDAIVNFYTVQINKNVQNIVL